MVLFCAEIYIIYMYANVRQTNTQARRASLSPLLSFSRSPSLSLGLCLVLVLGLIFVLVWECLWFRSGLSLGFGPSWWQAAHPIRAAACKSIRTCMDAWTGQLLGHLLGLVFLIWSLTPSEDSTGRENAAPTFARSSRNMFQSHLRRSKNWRSWKKCEHVSATAFTLSVIDHVFVLGSIFQRKSRPKCVQTLTSDRRNLKKSLPCSQDAPKGIPKWASCEIRTSCFFTWGAFGFLGAFLRLESPRRT